MGYNSKKYGKLLVALEVKQGTEFNFGESQLFAYLAIL